MVKAKSIKTENVDNVEDWNSFDEAPHTNNLSFVSTPQCNAHDVQECFNLEISSWEMKHDSLDDHECPTSFGCVQEIDLYLAEADSCSNSETNSNEGAFSTFDEEGNECVEEFNLM